MGATGLIRKRLVIFRSNLFYFIFHRLIKKSKSIDYTNLVEIYLNDIVLNVGQSN